MAVIRIKASIREKAKTVPIVAILGIYFKILSP
jgi:hypothetical protein